MNKKIYSDQEWNAIVNSDTFCPAPFFSYYIDTNNTLAACCIHNTANERDFIDRPLAELYNRDFFKNLRRDLLTGVKNKICDRCWKTEEISANSLRSGMLDWFKFWEASDRIRSSINEDYSLTDPTINYIDVRFDNTCNLRCRSCLSHYSTSWYAEEKAMKTQGVIPNSHAPVQFTNSTLTVNELKPTLDTCRRIYFAGGEPMVTPQHYEILQYLIDKGRTDIEIYYNTNFSKLTHGKHDAIELWKHFKDVTIGASLDGSRERGEYARKNISWQQVEKNRQRMIKEVPHVRFLVAATVSIMNAYDFPQHHRDWVERGFLGPADYTINLLFGPANYAISNLPDHHKQRLKQIYKDHIGWVQDQIKSGVNRQPDRPHWWNGDFRSSWNIDFAVSGIEGLIKQLDQPRDPSSYNMWNRDLWLDLSRGENFFKTFPEYLDIRPEVFAALDKHHPDADYSIWKS